ncbi:hypothetical protein PF002_g21314 [Phytophthora fragariae]|uniref:Uncharacterized protein n=1 Tax=Phytophthora fragariae TaxID=53985 RepID=A0A6A3XGL9_9STRA|nr:hypothetical protein PF002_g21314 [Phytophthora fragariae]
MTASSSVFEFLAADVIFVPSDSTNELNSCAVVPMGTLTLATGVAVQLAALFVVLFVVSAVIVVTALLILAVFGLVDVFDFVHTTVHVVGLVFALFTGLGVDSDAVLVIAPSPA